MTETVNIHEAKTQFSRLISRAQAGERVVIAKAGRPVAVLIPFEPVPRPPDRIPGYDKGKLVIHDDFDDPIPELEEHF